MINEVIKPDIPYILSETTQIAYSKFKALIQKIFSLLKRNKKEKNIKEEFYDSYMDFARKLDEEGFKNESYDYMAICAMYYDLMDRPAELINHEGFFNDLFKAFDELLSVKINNPNEYDSKYDEFLLYCGKMQQYYYTHIAIPSEYYDRDVLNEITNHLLGDCDE